MNNEDIKELINCVRESIQSISVVTRVYSVDISSPDTETIYYVDGLELIEKLQRMLK